MKTLLTYKYKYKKIIADNLQRLLAIKETEISDEEYASIAEAIETYLGNAEQEETEENTVSYQEFLSLCEEVALLRSEIEDNTSLGFDVQEDGLYFVDEQGYIVAKITATGLYAINLDDTGSGSSSEQSVAALNDLTDVLITDPANGEALIYNSTSEKWKNTTIASGGANGDITLLDY